MHDGFCLSVSNITKKKVFTMSMTGFLRDSTESQSQVNASVPAKS